VSQTRRSATYVQKNGDKSSRIEIDVLVEGTRADRKKTFALYFQKMKYVTENFRKFIGYRK
jgi:hypothetical protein